MNYIELLGTSIPEDIETIKSAIDKDSETVFVYSGDQTLYDYINALYDKNRGLDAEYLYKFKVCYEKFDNGPLKITYSKNGKRTRALSSMSKLINELDGISNCRIVVDNDDRVQLAFIVQQLIFIQYPLEKVDILLRKEERDADKTKRFMSKVDELLSGCNSAIEKLSELRDCVEQNEDEGEFKQSRLNDINDSLTTCRDIQKQIQKSIDVELKFAVAASKKAGKSVIVNCFLGEQIAPTSTELATPNNCIYRKSRDAQYHLKLDGEERIQNYETLEEIYDVIDGYFREAQNNKDSRFALPDMNIDYVTESNNFSSYTIFDTAGPDAAGTDHSIAAREAMHKCDVAVFAIDYAKYLNTSEEAYLRELKTWFASQNKFHSLIFALNKIDVRYTDTDSPKSFVMSVDFLKTRLANIDKDYKDCIIFPTCSLEYFSAIDAEKSGITELLPENNLSVSDMKNVKFAHKDVASLAWLHTHAENLEYYHGIKNISYDVFKKDSGMPALMSYVSYVARSKARDEIVNNVTFQIDSQRGKLQSVLDHIANIEALINADDDKINEISSIIKEYSDTVEGILSNEITPDDISVLDEDSIVIQHNRSFDELVSNQKKAALRNCDPINIAERMYFTARNKIWNRINDNMDGYEIDKLFTTQDFSDVANETLKITSQSTADLAKGQSDKVNREIEKIGNHRIEMIRAASIECREKLKKQNVIIELPVIPSFQVAVSLKPYNGNEINAGTVNFNLYDKLNTLFKDKFWVNISKWFGNVFGNGTDRDYIKKFTASKDEFVKKCDAELKPEFKNAVYENRVPEMLESIVKDRIADGYIQELSDERELMFNSMNDTFKASIAHFSSVVDDRERYIKHIEELNLCKDNIARINEYTSDFMNTWNEIIQDITEEVPPEANDTVMV